MVSICESSLGTLFSSRSGPSQMREEVGGQDNRNEYFKPAIFVAVTMSLIRRMNSTLISLNMLTFFVHASAYLRVRRMARGKRALVSC